jgi:uracil-DNA glycosylase
MTGGSDASLEDLLGEIRACRACAGELAHEPRPVVRVSSRTRILLCGQAPGRRVHESGLPFDDPSGDRLRGWMGVDRETFYGDGAIGVAAMAFCYPGTVRGGGDIPPAARCAQLWRARLMAQLPGVELTLLMGLPAQKWALGARHPGSMDAAVRNWRAFLPQVICLPHPSWRNTAWLNRNPWFDEDVTPYLRQRIAQILRP